jgi:hypothetical protein
LFYSFSTNANLQYGVAKENWQKEIILEPLENDVENLKEMGA